MFNNPELRKHLNAATHPLVMMEMARQLFVHWLLFRFVVVRYGLAVHEEHDESCPWMSSCCSAVCLPDQVAVCAALSKPHADRPPNPIVLPQVVDVPLLFEGGLDRFTSMNITVACDAETQRRRLMVRDNSQRAAADSRINAQVQSTHYSAA